MDSTKRKVMDCRKIPNTVNCSLTITGREDEVVRAAAEHAASVHGEKDTPEYREVIRKSLADETPENNAYHMSSM